MGSIPKQTLISQLLWTWNTFSQSNNVTKGGWVCRLPKGPVGKACVPQTQVTCRTNDAKIQSAPFRYSWDSESMCQWGKGSQESSVPGIKGNSRIHRPEVQVSLHLLRIQLCKKIYKGQKKGSISLQGGASQTWRKTRNSADSRGRKGGNWNKGDQEGWAVGNGTWNHWCRVWEADRARCAGTGRACAQSSQNQIYCQAGKWAGQRFWGFFFLI